MDRDTLALSAWESLRTTQHGVPRHNILDDEVFTPDLDLDSVCSLILLCDCVAFCYQVTGFDFVRVLRFRSACVMFLLSRLAFDWIFGRVGQYVAPSYRRYCFPSVWATADR